MKHTIFIDCICSLVRFCSNLRISFRSLSAIVNSISWFFASMKVAKPWDFWVSISDAPKTFLFLQKEWTFSMISWFFFLQDFFNYKSSIGQLSFAQRHSNCPPNWPNSNYKLRAQPDSPSVQLRRLSPWGSPQMARMCQRYDRQEPPMFSLACSAFCSWFPRKKYLCLTFVLSIQRFVLTKKNFVGEQIVQHGSII